MNYDFFVKRFDIKFQTYEKSPQYNTRTTIMRNA